MEKEIKIADLARLWNVSVNTTWKRINKEGLSTFKKLENNREITFVSVSEEILKKYSVNNGYNQPNEVVNEDLLRDDNIKMGEVIPENTTAIEMFMKYTKEVNEQLITLNNNYNEDLRRHYEELIEVKSRMPQLEDKAGTYLTEIADLKKNNEAQLAEYRTQIDDLKKTREEINKSSDKIIKGLISVIIVLFVLLVATAGALVYKLHKPTIIEKTNTIETIKEVEKPVVKTVYKRR